MHLKTNEVFQGTFKRTTLEKVLTYGKFTKDQILKISSLIPDSPDAEDGEIALMIVIQRLAAEMFKLEEREPFKVISENGTTVGVGLRSTETWAEVASSMGFKYQNFAFISLTPKEYNEILASEKFKIYSTYGI